MSPLRSLTLLSLFGILCLGLGACGSSGGGSNNPPPAIEYGVDGITLRGKAVFGGENVQVLVDGEEATLNGDDWSHRFTATDGQGSVTVDFVVDGEVIMRRDIDLSKQTKQSKKDAR